MFGCTTEGVDQAEDTAGDDRYGGELGEGEGGNDSGDGDTGSGSGSDGETEPGADEPTPTPLREITVDNVTALRGALTVAEPGDLIVLRDQVWNFTSYVDITRSGTAEHPIVIAAQTVGGARIGGVSGFRPTGVSHVVVRGFDFRFSAGARALTCKDCSHVRFTRNHFELAPVDYSHWLLISGASHHNRIDRNVFINKATSGNYVTIDGTTSQIASNNVIELNYFANQTWGGTNQGECVRVGYSGLKFSKGYNVLQYNLFEHCDGDPEVLSVKSSNNAIRFNTFRSNNGALVFRHGHQSDAIGNFFLDNNGGIRAYGDDHRIVNNYFEGNRGTGSRTTILIGSGTALDDAPLSAEGYDASERVLLAFNTLVDNASHIQIGSTTSDAVAATSCTIAGNLLVGSTGTFARTIRSSSASWADNLVSGAAATGDFPSASYTRTSDPKLVASGGFLHLAIDSPARDAAVGSYPGIVDDVDGDVRSGAFDIGADEYSTGTPARRPLTRTDVGPTAP